MHPRPTSWWSRISDGSKREYLGVEKHNGVRFLTSMATSFFRVEHQFPRHLSRIRPSSWKGDDKGNSSSRHIKLFYIPLISWRLNSSIFWWSGGPTNHDRAPTHNVQWFRFLRLQPRSQPNRMADSSQSAGLEYRFRYCEPVPAFNYFQVERSIYHSIAFCTWNGIRTAFGDLPFEVNRDIAKTTSQHWQNCPWH